MAAHDALAQGPFNTTSTPCVGEIRKGAAAAANPFPAIRPSQSVGRSAANGIGLLGLIGQAVTAAHAAGKWVGVCGGIASDPQAVPLLVGLGVDELSVSVPAIPSVKAQIRLLSFTDCQELAARALTQDSAASVRALVPTDDDEY